MGETIVIALGGNALIKHGQKGTFDEQRKNLSEPCRQIAHLAAKYNIALTHGNGPQIGYLLLQQEAAHAVPKMPLEVLVAESQGLLGYLIERALENEFRKLKVDKLIATIVTGVVVDENDPAFKNPTKPIGPYYSKGEAEKLPFQTIPIHGKGYRRVVPSPKPLRILEREEIRRLVRMGIIVIACGGGGIPMIERGEKIRGVEAVIDKDLATSKLAQEIKADAMILLTDVDKVSLNYGKPTEVELNSLTAAEAKKYLAAGHFPPGSMGPKVEAAIEFLESGGKRAVITSIDNLEAAVSGSAGTQIFKEKFK
ncbi:MAG: carbamate kinase [archaeon]